MTTGVLLETINRVQEYERLAREVASRITDNNMGGMVTITTSKLRKQGYFRHKRPPRGYYLAIFWTAFIKAMEAHGWRVVEERVKPNHHKVVVFRRC